MRKYLLKNACGKFENKYLFRILKFYRMENNTIDFTDFYWVIQNNYIIFKPFKMPQSICAHYTYVTIKKL
jgi:hypothetical protein